MIGSLSSFCNRCSVINSTTMYVSMMSPKNKIKEKFSISLLLGGKNKQERNYSKLYSLTVSYFAYHKLHIVSLLNFNFSRFAVEDSEMNRKIEEGDRGVVESNCIIKFRLSKGVP